MNEIDQWIEFPSDSPEPVSPATPALRADIRRALGVADTTTATCTTTVVPTTVYPEVGTAPWWKEFFRPLPIARVADYPLEGVHRVPAPVEEIVICRFRSPPNRRMP